MSVFFDAQQRCWVYDFREGGRRYKRRAKNPDGTPAASRRQAQAAEDLARVAARNAARGQAIARPGDYTLAQAIAARAAEAEGYESWPGIRAALRDIAAHFGGGTAIADVAAGADSYRARVAGFTRRVWIGGPSPRADRRDPRNWRDTGRPMSAERKNKYLDELGALLMIAHRTLAPATKTPMLERLPQIKPFDIPGRDPTPVPLAVLARIEGDPETPDHLWKAAALARLFGLRRDEVFAASADWIDWENPGLRIPAAIAKADRDDFVPANEEARQLLAWLALEAADRGARADGIADDDRHLIVYRPPGVDAAGRPWAARPIKSIKRAWATALRRAGIEGRYRFHDVRATFITGVAHVASAKVTQDLARHKDAATTARYTKIADEAKRAAVDAMRGTGDIAARGPGFALRSPTAPSHRPALRRVK